MVVTDDMGRDDELPVAVSIEILDEDILIGSPRRASYEHLIRLATHEGLYQRQLLAGRLDLQHTVEARVACNGHIADTDAAEQLSALLVLHKEMGETSQHTGIALAIPAKEDLLLTKNARHTVGRHAAVLEDMQVVEPELILDKECHLWPDDAQEAAGIADGVEWQVTTDVGTLVVLTHLVA